MKESLALRTGCELRLPAWLEEFIDEWSHPLDTVEDRMRLAIALAAENIRRKTGGPFGSIVVEETACRLLGVGVNRVTGLNLSLAHAEMIAVSLAQSAVGDWNLGAGGRSVQLVTSCEPCAMCFGAVPWSGVSSLVWGALREDAEAAGFDEGGKPADWVEMLERRGIRTQGGVMRGEAASVLRRYVRKDGIIYNPERE